MKFFETEDPQTRTKLQRLLCLLILVVPVFIFGVFAEVVNPYLEFNRERVSSGEVWRLLTSSFAHLGSNHMFMNLSVYILATLIFSPALSLLRWHVALVICCASVGVGLLLFDTNVVGYVGLSGALYGMVAFGLLMNIKENVLIYALSYVFVAYKVISQQLSGYDPVGMVEFIGGNVIESAHLFGWIAGNLCAVFLYCKLWFKRKS